MSFEVGSAAFRFDPSQDAAIPSTATPRTNGSSNVSNAGDVGTRAGRAPQFFVRASAPPDPVLPCDRNSHEVTSTKQAAPEPAPPEVVWLERRPFARPRFELLQQWQGIVMEIREDEFVARLSDLTNPANSEEEATFDVREVSESDLELLECGAIFYLSIGYETSIAGQKKRVAQFRFRRMPAWSRKAIEDLGARLEATRRLFDTFE
jgi:hypothetical protein